MMLVRRSTQAIVRTCGPVACWPVSRFLRPGRLCLPLPMIGCGPVRLRDDPGGVGITHAALTDPKDRIDLRHSMPALANKIVLPPATVILRTGITSGDVVHQPALLLGGESQ